MPKTRPYVLSVAGFDPSGGAGCIADAKTFEQHMVVGFSVATGITFQDEDTVFGVDWLDTHQVISQMRPLLERYEIDVLKIGLIRDDEMLEAIVDEYRLLQPQGYIIWDPVNVSSSGFKFSSAEKSPKMLSKLDLITPNIPELESFRHPLAEIVKQVNVLLTGGHDPHTPGLDRLYLKKGEVFEYEAKKNNLSEKHGSGCMYSASIAAEIAKGNTLGASIEMAKKYIEDRLGSNITKLAYHS